MPIVRGIEPPTLILVGQSNKLVWLHPLLLRDCTRVEIEYDMTGQCWVELWPSLLWRGVNAVSREARSLPERRRVRVRVCV